MDFIKLFLIFMTIQNILIYLEFYYYYAMTWDIEQEKMNYFKNWTEFFKMCFSYVTFYSCVVYLFMITYSSNIYNSFFLGSVIYGIVDINVYGLFNKTNDYIPVLLNDIFVLGGFQFGLMTYLIKNNYTDLRFWSIGFLSSLLILLNRAYSYGINKNEGAFALKNTLKIL